MRRSARWTVQLVFAGLFVLGGSAPLWAQVQVPAPSSSEDPNQLSTAGVLFVKVDPASGTDTILVLNRQQLGTEVPGSAITIKLIFYDAGCDKTFDKNLTLTPQDVEIVSVSSFFPVTEPGVVLAYVAAGSGTGGAINVADDKFLLSGVVVDGEIGAIYERKASPLLSIPAATALTTWAGFSGLPVDDWYIGGVTALQALCPQGFLANDMHRLQTGDPANGQAFASQIQTISVYNGSEVLIRSEHEVPCSCNTDSEFFGDFADVIADMNQVGGVGTFHWDAPTNGGTFLAWRVISIVFFYWDARLSRTP